MPYILPRRREKLDEGIDAIAAAIRGMMSNQADPTSADGDLNYTITLILSKVLDLANNPRYHSFNTAVGVLDCVKMEMYRRKAVPYEDKKIAENGDVI